METIKSYVENVFARLANTEEMRKIKNDMLSHMEDKFNELREEGKSENEAIGIVISEFGNIDELLEEMGVEKEQDENQVYLSMEEAKEYVEIKRKNSYRIALGVFMILMGVSLMITVLGIMGEDGIFKAVNENVASGIGIGCLFIMFVPAIALFIFSGMREEKFKFIEEGKFSVTSSVSALFTKDYDGAREKSTYGVIIGVCLFVISPIPLVVMALLNRSTAILLFATSFILIVVGIGVAIIIVMGAKKESYEKLLQLGEFSKEHREKNKKIDNLASIYWPVIVILFFVLGFCFHGWRYSWVVFPIGGILFGFISRCLSE